MTEEDPNNPVLLYLAEAEKLPALTRQEIIAVAKRIALGGDEAEQAKRELIEAHLKLVVAIAAEYANFGLGKLELIQEGNIGLMVAVDQFDYTVHDDFVTHAAPLVRQAIIEALRAQGLTD